MNAIEFKGVWKKFRKGERHDSLRDLVPNMAKNIFRSSKHSPLNANPYTLIYAIQNGGDKKMLRLLLALTVIIIIAGCKIEKPNLNSTGESELTSGMTSKSGTEADSSDPNLELVFNYNPNSNAGLESGYDGASSDPDYSDLLSYHSPEPATLALFGIGLGGLATAMWCPWVLSHLRGGKGSMRRELK